MRDHAKLLFIWGKYRSANLPLQRATPMKKKSKNAKDNELRPQYDLEELLKGGVGVCKCWVSFLNPTYRDPALSGA